ncbi:nucleotidyl transferase AbiEii/AbiGii toxin family protein [Elongatibacter sediminis]|uniref:Nucleotidyl transferase AbiEii/AbiGii toxin family protein n=1 Tax=Elongatibacter sediminis TaxID=3119006 RepID=A0AAW9R8B3_9GAMM
MIPRDYITEWRGQAPWVDDAQVEQDLVISRALIDIFSNDLLHDALAFRGGTALFKLHLPAARYSEDIDLVQVKAEAAGPMMAALHEVLNPWLGEPTYNQTDARITFKYRFQSEDGQPLRLKVEINTRGHFAVEGFQEMPFEVNSRWYERSCSISTYGLNELLGTKLRALYQRKKGRDLFDLAVALDETNADPEKIIETFCAYMKHGGHHVTRKQFEENLANKLGDSNFHSDLGPLLASGYESDLDAMSVKVNDLLITRLAD